MLSPLYPQCLFFHLLVPHLFTWYGTPNLTFHVISAVRCLHGPHTLVISWGHAYALNICSSARLHQFMLVFHLDNVKSSHHWCYWCKNRCYSPKVNLTRRLSVANNFPFLLAVSLATPTRPVQEVHNLGMLVDSYLSPLE